MTQCQGWLRKFGSKGGFSDTRSAEGMHNIPAGPCFWAQPDSTFASEIRRTRNRKVESWKTLSPGPPHSCQQETTNGQAPIQQTTGTRKPTGATRLFFKSSGHHHPESRRERTISILSAVVKMATIPNTDSEHLVSLKGGEGCGLARRAVCPADARSPSNRITIKG